MNDLSTSLPRSTSHSGRWALLLISLSFACVPSITHAQSMHTEQDTPTRSSASDQAAEQTISEQAQPIAQTPPPPPKSQSGKDTFEREKRAEELRYKHLWFAYSLVWLIIFIFIRKTWRRSQEVEQRIIELQNRLSKIE